MAIPAPSLQPLDPDHLAAFRKDFQDKEGEINKYISIYLSALAVVTGWIIGPQSKSALTLIVGNNAYNISLLFAVVFINVVFSGFLAYKGLIIHDVTQFVAYAAPVNDGYLAWEGWRRSKYSATTRVRKMYAGMISAIPVLVSIALMVLLAYFLLHSPGQLAIWAKQAGADTNLEQITRARVIGGVLWVLMAALHAVPVRLFRESAARTECTWKELLALRPDILRFDSLAPHPFAPPPATPPPTAP